MQTDPLLDPALCRRPGAYHVARCQREATMFPSLLAMIIAGTGCSNEIQEDMDRAELGSKGGATDECCDMDEGSAIQGRLASNCKRGQAWHVTGPLDLPLATHVARHELHQLATGLGLSEQVAAGLVARDELHELPTGLEGCRGLLDARLPLLRRPALRQPVDLLPHLAQQLLQAGGPTAGVAGSVSRQAGRRAGSRGCGVGGSGQAPSSPAQAGRQAWPSAQGRWPLQWRGR